MGAGGAAKAISSVCQRGRCTELSGLFWHLEDSIHPAEKHNFNFATEQTNHHSCSAHGKGREVQGGEGRGAEGTEHVVCRENERELKVLWRCVWEPKLHYFCCH